MSCKTCKFLSVRDTDSGKRIVRKNEVFPCLAPCPPEPAMPHSFRKAHGIVPQPAIRGFDPLHPLHLSPRQISVFPCESPRNPSTDGLDLGYEFTRNLHRVSA